MPNSSGVCYEGEVKWLWISILRPWVSHYLICKIGIMLQRITRGLDAVIYVSCMQSIFDCDMPDFFPDKQNKDLV